MGWRSSVIHGGIENMGGSGVWIGTVRKLRETGISIAREGVRTGETLRNAGVGMGE